MGENMQSRMGGFEVTEVSQSWTVGTMGTEGSGMGHIEDPNALELEQESVVTTPQFALKGRAHRTTLANEERPVADRGKA